MRRAIVVRKKVKVLLRFRRWWSSKFSFPLQFLLDDLQRLPHKLCLKIARCPKTHHIVVVRLIQGRRIWYLAFHYPSLGFILRANEVPNFSFGGNMSRSQIGLPIRVRPAVSPFHYVLQLLVRPCIQIYRFDSTDVGSHATMESGTSDTDKDAQIPARPSRKLVMFAIRTDTIRREFQQILDNCLVGDRLIRGSIRSSRHWCNGRLRNGPRKFRFCCEP